MFRAFRSLLPFSGKTLSNPNYITCSPEIANIITIVENYRRSTTPRDMSHDLNTHLDNMVINNLHDPNNDSYNTRKRYLSGSSENIIYLSGYLSTRSVDHNDNIVYCNIKKEGDYYRVYVDTSKISIYTYAAMITCLAEYDNLFIIDSHPDYCIINSNVGRRLEHIVFV